MNKGYPHGGDITSAAERWGFSPEELIDFSASINPLGPPPKVLEALAHALPKIVHYPDPACRQARSALSAFLRVDPRCLALGNGAAEIIWLLPSLLRPKRALLPVPSFTLYDRALHAAGTEIQYFFLPAERGFTFPFDQVMGLLNGGAHGRGPDFDLIWLANPNNPTGRTIPQDHLLALAEACIRRAVTLVVDEAFILFLPDWRRRSLAQVAAGSDRVIVIGSLTKFFAIPGLRLGYVVGSPSLVERLVAWRDPWPVNTLAQVACAEALGDDGYLVRTQMVVAEERAFLLRSLEAMGWVRPLSSEANFLLVELSPVPGPSSGCGSMAAPVLRASALCDLMGQRGILIRDCSNFRGLSHRYVRIAVRRREDNLRLVEALRGLNGGG